MRIVALTDQKGGVGKTTCTMNLAAVASKHARVLVVDVDPQKSTTWWAENAGENLPFDFSDATDPHNLSRLRELDYDVVFVDTPGNLEDTHILGAVLDVTDFAVVPLTPESLSIPPTVKTIRTLIEPREVPYRVLLNRVDMRIPGQLEDWQSLIDNKLKLPRFQQHVRQYKTHADAPLLGHVVTQYPDTRQTTNAIYDYTTVALELTSIWANGTEKTGRN